MTNSAKKGISSKYLHIFAGGLRMEKNSYNYWANNNFFTRLSRQNATFLYTINIQIPSDIAYITTNFISHTLCNVSSFVERGKQVSLQGSTVIPTTRWCSNGWWRRSSNRRRGRRRTTSRRRSRRSCQLNTLKETSG